MQKYGEKAGWKIKLRYDLKIGQQGEGTFIYRANNGYL